MTSFPNAFPRGWALPVVLLVCAAAYLAFVVETADDPAFAMPLIDGAAYHRQALEYLDGGAGDGAPYWQPPLYTWWLTGIYRVVGVAPGKARYVQVVFALLTVALVFQLGRRLGGIRGGIISGLITGLNGPLLFYYGQFFPAGLAVTLDVMVLWLLLRAFEHGRLRDWLLCGLGLGVAALAVPNVLIVGAAAVLLLLIGDGDRWTPKLTRSAALLCGVALCILPVTIRNAVTAGQFVPISTNAGINLFIGNNARAMESMAIRPGLDWDRLVRTPFEEGAGTETEAQSFFMEQVVAYSLSDPVGLFRGLWVKVRLLLTGLEVPRNVDIYVFGKRSVVLGALVWRTGWFGFPFALLFPLAVCGSVLGFSDRRVRVTVVCAAAYAVSVVIFFPTARYRAPLIPFLALLAGRSLSSLFSGPPDRRRLLPRAAAAAGAALVLCCWPVVLPTAGVNFEAELENAIGAGMEVRGDRPGAMERYREALRIDPESWEAHYNLGNALRLQGRLEEALQHYRRAVVLRPDHDRALTNMGIALAQQGRLDEAAISLAVALKHDQWNTQALLSLGACHIQTGNVEGGIRCLERALEVERDNVAALQNLAGALYLQGEYADAVERCGRALARSPNNAAVHNTLGMALLALGRVQEARTHVETAARLDPRYRRSLETFKKPVQ